VACGGKRGVSKMKEKRKEKDGSGWKEGKARKREKVVRG
jgi:hypothetical protein